MTATTPRRTPSTLFTTIWAAVLASNRGYVSDARLRHAILAQIISFLPNLSAVDIDIVSSSSNKPFELMASLQGVGPKVLDLTLHEDLNNVTEPMEQSLGSFLGSFPNLTRLELDHSFHPHGRKAFLSTLVSLASLTTLKIGHHGIPRRAPSSAAPLPTFPGPLL